MENDTGAPEAPAHVHEVPADTPERLSTTQAARLLASLRKPAQKEQAAAPVEAPPPPVEQAEESTADAEDAAPPQEATGETEEADPTPEESPLDPPRSWAKDKSEVWAKLDRGAQELLLAHDREVSAAVRRAQNEAAEARKAAEARMAQAEQASKQYETALPQLMQTLESQTAGQFGDIKTMADVERLATEDWPRYLQWDLAQKKLAAVRTEMQAAQQRQQDEQRQKFAEFAAKEDKLLLEKVPEMADPKKAAELQTAAKKLLTDLGFDDNELGKAWNAHGEFSLRDHRVQMLVVDAINWRNAQAKAKEVTKKPVPPVQRPGASQPKGAAEAARITELNKQLSNARGQNAQLRIAAQIRAAQLRATG